MVTIAIGNQKGGCGKTATAHALGFALSQRWRVLMIDVDPQASLTAACDVSADEGEGLTAVLDNGAAVASQLWEVSKNLDLLPASIGLASTVIALAGKYGRESLLRRSLSAVSASYDVCLIDCPPSRDLLTVNALAAADAVLIPTQPQMADIRGLSLYLEAIAELRAHEVTQAEILGILPTFYDGRLLHHQQAVEAMISAGWPVLDIHIGRSVRVAEAAGLRQSIIEYEPSNARALEYKKLARKIERWLKERQ